MSTLLPMVLIELILANRRFTIEELTGSINEMKNQAYKMKADLIHVVSVDVHKSAMSLGTTHATQVGHAYSCK